MTQYVSLFLLCDRRRRHILCGLRTWVLLGKLTKFWWRSFHQNRFSVWTGTFDTRRMLNYHRLKKRHYYCTTCEDIFSSWVHISNDLIQLRQISQITHIDFDCSFMQLQRHSHNCDHNSDEEKIYCPWENHLEFQQLDNEAESLLWHGFPWSLMISGCWHHRKTITVLFWPMNIVNCMLTARKRPFMYNFVVLLDFFSSPEK